MKGNIPKEYIANISKASAYFAFRNGPIKELQSEGKLSKEDVIKIQNHMENHLAYLYTVLLEENNLKKFDLVISTMNKFYVEDNEQVVIEDDGFDNLYKGLFSQSSNITIK